MDSTVHALATLPATDLNFTSALRKATDEQIEQAIDKMIDNGGKHKGRIKACQRELDRRNRLK